MSPGRKQRPRADEWTAAELRTLARLSSIERIQQFLEDTPYSCDPIYRSPRAVLRDRRAHCFDGAMLAAAALERLGHEPVLLDLLAVNDDDHVLAVYRWKRWYGALSKSNFATLGGRAPVYRSLRELALSYFDQYFNTKRDYSLGAYSTLVHLRRFERLEWRTNDAAMEAIASALGRARHRALVPRGLVLPKFPKRLFDSGMAGADPAGVFQAR